MPTTELTFFVALDGNDSWSGMLAVPNAEASDGPFATLVAARNAVRKLKNSQDLDLPVTVMVREGKHHLDQPLLLGSNDGGSHDCPITYTAYPNETPIISGGRRISSWKPYKDNIICSEIPEAKGGRWTFRQLFLNGERMIRARTPNHVPNNPLNGGWAFVEAPVEDNESHAFRYHENTFDRDWAKPQQAEVHLTNGMGVSDILKIQEIDRRAHTITLTDRVKDHSAMPYASYAHHHRAVAAGYRFYVANVLEELDQPGEWCLDTEDGVLYFWPPGPSLKDAEVIAPMLDCLIDLRAVSHVHISGFTFTETRCAGDNMHREGHEGYGAMLPTGGKTYVGETLHAWNATHCHIENNQFVAVGGNGIYMEGANARNVIRRNEIHDAGAIGICLIGSQYTNTKMKRRHPIYNALTDNHIHHCGFFDKYAPGIFLGLSQSNVVANNHLEYLPHHAINLGNSGFGRNIVEYNEIRHVCLETADKGAINTWMEDPYGHVERQAPRAGHVIRYNLIVDLETRILDQNGDLVESDPPNDSFGIYLDNYASNCFVYGNTIVRGGTVGIYVQGGQNNMIENNIIVDALCATHFGGWWQPQMEGFMTGNHFSRNIIYRTSPTPSVIHRHIGYTTEAISDAIGQSDHNVLFNAGNGGFTVLESSSPLSDLEDSKRVFPCWPRVTEVSYEQWQTMGFDRESVIGDPLFVDPAGDDYRLQSNSPALQLGFVPIDVTRAGVRPRGRVAPK